MVAAVEEPLPLFEQLGDAPVALGVAAAEIEVAEGIEVAGVHRRRGVRRRGGFGRGGCGHRRVRPGGGLRGGEVGVAGVQRTRLVEQRLHLGLLAAMARPLGGVEEALDVGRGLVALTGRGGEACQLGIGGDRLAVGGGELEGLFEAPRLDQLAQP